MYHRLRLILAVVVFAALLGGFFAWRWFRGETAYEQALEERGEGPPLQAQLNRHAAPA